MSEEAFNILEQINTKLINRGADHLYQKRYGTIC